MRVLVVRYTNADVFKNGAVDMAVFDKAIWKGPVPNENAGEMKRPLLGLVFHVEQGTEAGTNSWFHNPGAEASAHFGNPKSGALDQWVDTNDKAWAEKSGNDKWISVEHEGFTGESLTATQIENDAQLLAWLYSTEGVALQVSDGVNNRGVGWHGMGGEAWGNHPDCPGDPIKAQRHQIIDRAKEIIGGSPSPTPSPEPQPQEVDAMLLPVPGAKGDANGRFPFYEVNAEGHVHCGNHAPFIHDLDKDVPEHAPIIGIFYSPDGALVLVANDDATFKWNSKKSDWL